MCSSDLRNPFWHKIIDQWQRVYCGGPGNRLWTCGHLHGQPQRGTAVRKPEGVCISVELADLSTRLDRSGSKIWV